MSPWVGLQNVIVVFPDHTYLLFGPKSNEISVRQKGQRITYILKRPCMIFLGFFEVKLRFCSHMQGKESLLSISSKVYLKSNNEVKWCKKSRNIMCSKLVALKYLALRLSQTLTVF